MVEWGEGLGASKDDSLLLSQLILACVGRSGGKEGVRQGGPLPRETTVEKADAPFPRGTVEAKSRLWGGGSALIVILSKGG